MTVVYQKAEKAAANRACNGYKSSIALEHADKGNKHRYNCRNGACESVDAVCKIGAVVCSEHYKKKCRNIEPSQIQIEIRKGNPHEISVIRRKVQIYAEDQSEHKLTGKFLFRIEALGLVLNHL